jgi:hypothetical protein
MNGLSAMGAGVANFAGSAGLEQQKATLAQQGMVLADQLAHASKTAENAQQGTIAAGAAEKLQESTMAQLAVTTASAQKVAATQAGGVMGAASISAAASRANTAAVIAANAPLVAQQTAEAAAQAGLAGDSLQLANTSTGLSLQIAAETAKPPEQQDPTKIASLMQQRSQLGMTPDVAAKLLGSMDGMIKATQQEATGADAAVARVIGQESALNMGDPTVRDRQKAEEAQVTQQRDAIYGRLNLLVGTAQSYFPRGAGAASPTPAAAGKTPPASQFDPHAAAPNPSAAGPAAGPRPGLVNSAIPTPIPAPF